MKRNQSRSLMRSDEAVSPVIAVILMVAITVVLAATVFVLVQDIGGGQSVPPTANLAVEVDHAADTVQLKHVSGDRFFTGDWRVSLIDTATGSNTFVTCTTDFEVGDTLTFSTESDAPATCTGAGLAGGTALAAGDYKLVVIHVPSSTTLLDQVIQIA